MSCVQEGIFDQGKFKSAFTFAYGRETVFM
ncbi:unnamed protein product [Larinioides sclopetarius]|uniref:Uncharacterized protein n=1 Tax=Larinioides sclopetarius TaxID=280406 RepID=A0AAV2ACT3_9ARAC